MATDFPELGKNITCNEMLAFVDGAFGCFSDSICFRVEEVVSDQGEWKLFVASFSPH